MKVKYVKLGFIALLFVCLYSVNVGYADIVWSDDFDDGDFDGWTIGLGEWTVINGTIQGQDPDPVQPYCTLSKASTVVFGTWSFDIMLKPFKNLYVAFIDSNGSFADFGYYYELKIAPQSDSTHFIFFKTEGSQADTQEALYNHIVYDGLQGAWHHVDITREPNGKFSFYLDTELLFEVIDNNIVTSETYVLTSQQHGAFVDNIEVSDEIRIWSDNFNDGDYDGWNVSLGDFTAENRTLETLEKLTIIHRESNISMGTWSLDVFMIKHDWELLNIWFLSDKIMTDVPPYGWNGSTYFLTVYIYASGTEFHLRYLNGTYQVDPLEVLAEYTAPEDLSMIWHHIDITRDELGKITIYLDEKPIIEYTDTRINNTNYFQIATYSKYAEYDNIQVSDDFRSRPHHELPLVPMSVTAEVEEGFAAQGDEVLVEIDIENDYGLTVQGASVILRLDDQTIIATEEPDGGYSATIDTSEQEGLVEYVVTAEKRGYIPSETTHLITVVASTFVTSDLSIVPNSISIGETVVISADVSNVGGQEGSHHVVLRINGVVADEYGVTLVPGGSETVMFEYVPTQSGTFTVGLGGLTGSFSVVAPALFEVTNLIIDPDSLKEGESVAISVTCSNVGGASGSYDVVLKIDGMTEDESTVTVDAGESKTVSFDVSASQSGTYSVEVNGLSGSYEVTKQQQGIPGFPFESLLLGLISGVLVLWILQRNRISHL